MKQTLSRGALFPVEIRHFGGKIMVMKQLTKISIAWELFEQQVPKSHIAKKLEVNQETVHLWLKGIQNHSLLANTVIVTGLPDPTGRTSKPILKALIVL